MTDHRDRGSNRAVAAFTLVEVAIVVVILSILLLVAQPRFASVVQNDRLRRAAQKVAMDIRLAQSEAIKQQAKVGVEFSLDADAYRLVGLSVAKNGTTKYEVYLGADPSYRTSLTDAEFNGRLDVAFDRFGSPDSGGSVTLGIGRLQIVLTVDAGTGRVTIGPLCQVTKVAGPPVIVLPPEITYGGAKIGGEIQPSGLGTDGPGEGLDVL